MSNITYTPVSYIIDNFCQKWPIHESLKKHQLWNSFRSANYML